MNDQPVTVLVFGTFDKLHAGHRFFLQKAREQGDRLVVVIARDHNVHHVKGHWPRDNEQKRQTNVTALPYVDETRLGLEEYSKKESIILMIKPDIICLGYDQAPDFQSPMPGIPVIRFPAYKPEMYKSSFL